MVFTTVYRTLLYFSMVFLPFPFHDTEITAHIMEYTSGLLLFFKAQMGLKKYG